MSIHDIVIAVEIGDSSSEQPDSVALCNVEAGEPATGA
jgi:hypothetical protein